MGNTHHNGYTEAEAITRTFGTSYYYATRFLPRSTRQGIYALYAFFRIPDEYVDNPDSALTSDQVLAQMEDWTQSWHRAVEMGRSDHPILNVTIETFQRYQIPSEYADAFLKAMLQDLTVSRYRTYRDLYEYMYGAAVVVGCMISYVIGFRQGALPYAEKLGEAMQMTNFLRDIREDYEDRNRIYLPVEHMEQFGVTEEHIRNHICDENFKALMKFEIQNVRTLYRESDYGISFLTRQGRFGVKIASRLYEAILDKIEDQDYNIFAGRVRTNSFEKLKIVIATLFGH